MTKHLFALLVILIGAIILSLPLLESGLYQIHDDQHIARLFLFDQALKAGQFPVRWVDSLGFGFGYPLFIFYPPLVYVIGEIFHLAGFGFIDSIKLVFFSSIFFSGVAIYIFVKELWGKFPALVSAIFYMFIPYRALDVYVRGALAESFAFVWLPLILWSFYKLHRTNKPTYILYSAVFLALLMITHNLIFLPFMIILPIYFLFLFFRSEEKKLLTLNFLLSFFLALGLSAFFWMPALLEKKFTIVDQLLLVNLANYKIHFVFPRQLWNWTWGFGGSAPGLADGISFKIGKLHIIVSALSFIMAIIFLFKSKIPKLENKNYSYILLIFILFILSAFMTTSLSNFLWGLMPPLAYLQFPWRFLIFTALFSSILAGALIYQLRFTFIRLIIGILLILLLFFPNIKLFQPQKYRSNLTDELATSDKIINLDVSASSFEYIPKGVDIIESDLGTNVVNIQKDDIPRSKVEIISGEVTISELNTKPHKIKFTADSQNGATLKSNLFSFPGWEVLIDGNKIEIKDKNRLKLIIFDVPKGLSHVEINFNNTMIRSLANFISLFSIFILFILIFKKWPIHNNN